MCAIFKGYLQTHWRGYSESEDIEDLEDQSILFFNESYSPKAKNVAHI